MKVVGIRNVKFDGRDGLVTGVTVYYLYPLTSDNSEGYGCDKAFISTNKLNTTGYIPKINDNVTILYDKNGKIQRIIEDADNDEIQIDY